MNILAIRTDKPDAELYVFVGGQQKAQKMWLAHRQLAETLNNVVHELCKEVIGDQSHLEGIVFYNDGNSFTGLRIGASVANAFAASLQIPIIGTTGNNWVNDGVQKLEDGSVKVGNFIDPHYFMPATITQPKK